MWGSKLTICRSSTRIRRSWVGVQFWWDCYWFNVYCSLVGSVRICFSNVQLKFPLFFIVVISLCIAPLPIVSVSQVKQMAIFKAVISRKSSFPKWIPSTPPLMVTYNSPQMMKQRPMATSTCIRVRGVSNKKYQNIWFPDTMLKFCRLFLCLTMNIQTLDDTSL